MLGHPRVIGCTLQRQVQRDLDVRRRGGRDQGLEVLEGPELGMDRLVAAVGAADRPRAADIAETGGRRIVAALARDVPIGWIGGR